MKQHTHDFVETYEGFVGYGFDRETDQNTVIYYLQKFSDDNLQEILTQRMSDEDLENLFNNISALLGKYLSESEYHQLFLKNHGE